MNVNFCQRHDFFLSKANGSDFGEELQNTKHNHTKHSQSKETNIFNLNQNNKKHLLLAHSNDNPTQIKLFLITYFDAQPHQATNSTPENAKYCSE